jgi:hypothetical protein
VAAAIHISTQCVHEAPSKGVSIVNKERARERLSYLLTFCPLDAHNEGDMAISRVFGQFTGSSADRATQADLRINVQRERRAARRPDGGREWD